MTANGTNTAVDIDALFLKIAKGIVESEYEKHHKQLLINTTWTIRDIAKSDDVRETILDDEEAEKLKDTLPVHDEEDIEVLLE